MDSLVKYSDAATREQVRVTGELKKRNPKPAALEAENRTLHRLAECLTQDPTVLLQAVVDAAVELCGAGSAGISLIETQADGTKLFRWVAMSGRYSGFVGGWTPLDESPCGDTMRLGAAQLYHRPARYYTCLAPADPELYEGLVIPLPGARGDSSIGTIWVALHDGARRFDAEDVRIMTSIASFTAAALSTQRLLVDAHLARAAAERASAAKTAFVANMSHEIRTPMNAVLGLAEVLARSSPLSPRQLTYIETLKSSGRLLMDLINDVLDISKIEAEAFEIERTAFRPAGVVADVADMMSLRASQKRLRFTARIMPGVEGLFEGDPQRLRQILTNLCGNAVKFTEAGAVVIKADTTETGLVFTVSDTGIGMSDETAATIFEKFSQGEASINRRFGGTGLGLSITRELVKQMGGEISVTSRLNEGSAFTVKLPMPRCEARVASTEADAAPLSVLSGTVLLVEDSAPNAIVAQAHLEHMGLDCDIVTDGAAAIEKALAGDYVAILMDLQMQGIDGIETTHAIRAQERREKKPARLIVGMTAHALSGDRQKCLDAGMNDYLTKPYTAQLLETVLRRNLMA